MLLPFKTYIADNLIGSTLHFKCDCVFPIDVDGIIKDYEIIDGEIIFKVLVGDKIVSIGENHPKMMVEPL